MVVVVLGIILTIHQTNRIIHHAEQQNISLSRLLSNSIKTALPAYLDTPDPIEPESLKARQIVKQLDDLLHSMAVGLPLLKVKIYNVSGLTLYSSDPSQIGQSKADNAGFLRAVDEQKAVSKLSYRDDFSAFSGALFNLDVVETYIPVVSDNNKVMGVFELYTDVTDFRTAVRAEMIWLFSLLLSIFILFFFILFLIIRRADNVIEHQYEKLEKNHDKIEKRVEVLYQQANFDGLTKLTNRVHMYGQLKHDLERAARYKTMLALLFIDLDKFKDINDTRGHDAGDNVLVAIAKRLSECAKKYDARFRAADSDDISTVARIGGDEFTVIIPNVSSTNDIETVAKEIISECSKPLKIRNRKSSVSVSIGIALYPIDGHQPGLLMRSADLAMYQSKQEGRNTFRYFVDELDKSGERRIVT